MSLLTDLPAELRQHIIRLIPGSVPEEIRLDYTGWPGPVDQLLLTCKLLRADTIQLMSTWSFDCLIPRSDDFERLPRLICAMQTLGLKNKVRKIRLLIWSNIEIEHVRPLGDHNYRGGELRRIGLRMGAAWRKALRMLPPGDIKTVVIDATPLPQTMIERHPNLVRANLIEPRTQVFVSENWRVILFIITLLKRTFKPVEFKQPLAWPWRAMGEGEGNADLPQEPACWERPARLVLGGQFAERSRSTIKKLLNTAGTAPERDKTSIICSFHGTVYDGELPARLSLHRLVQRCGIHLEISGSPEDYALDVAGITLPEGPQTNDVEPDKDFSALSPLAVSKNSATAYYVNALEDEASARAVVTKLLKFAVDSRQSSDARSLDFLPALPHKRSLVYELCRDLGLESKNTHGEYGTIVRITSSRKHNTDHLLEQAIEALSVSPTEEAVSQKE